MKIENSSIAMQSSHLYSQSRSIKINTSIRLPSEKDNSLGFSQNLFNMPLQTEKSASASKVGKNSTTAMSLRAMVVQKLLDYLARKRGIGTSCGMNNTDNIVDLRDEMSTSGFAAGSVWKRTTEKSYSFAESEATTFTSTGYARTEDGRTISFGIDVSMSREFVCEYTEYEEADYIVTDPLIINVGNDVTSVTDMKFLFDLDSDGVKEEISFAGKGNGFLSLDLNGDGIINDGRELFGTGSGNGFADLARYDKDGNGWIDENDEIFEKLKIWTKDENGNDQLISLKKADVGAIFLGHANSQFALTDENNYANAFIRSTGIYLKESGGVGTISQVDFTS